jgi:hypothetical protein
MFLISLSHTLARDPQSWKSPVVPISPRQTLGKFLAPPLVSSLDHQPALWRCSSVPVWPRPPLFTVLGSSAVLVPVNGFFLGAIPWEQSQEWSGPSQTLRHFLVLKRSPKQQLPARDIPLCTGVQRWLRHQEADRSQCACRSGQNSWWP